MKRYLKFFVGFITIGSFVLCAFFYFSRKNPNLLHRLVKGGEGDRETGLVSEVDVKTVDSDIDEMGMESGVDSGETNEVSEPGSASASQVSEEVVAEHGALDAVDDEVVLSFAEIRELEAFDVVDISGLSSDGLEELFFCEEISDETEQRILHCSYEVNDTIGLSELRYLRVLHFGFDQKTHIGELIVNVEIAEEILAIMKALYVNQYPIEKMVLVDQYGADDNRSMADNNSSAFNYRFIAGSEKLSKHSLGLAIDINPQFNPYIRQDEAGQVIVEPVNGGAYIDRDLDFPYKINEEDLCYQLFHSYGYTWGGDWNSVKDYQHFEK